MRYQLKEQVFEVLRISKEPVKREDGSRYVEVILFWRQANKSMEERFDPSKKLTVGQELKGTITVGVSPKTGKPYSILELDNA